ncbi:LacI family DNA-binding transcriptional regulator [Kineococcus gynurae]|uniref:LacI family DNA-binding transcriptional regulator n=1 Tax=Kineococcus gynurae TaxID=452979 RepID=A0ABV5LNZ9_9ACTN
MAHPYRIREIAAQAGLSEATVDRVLHARGGVRASTVAEVQQAVADLDRQRTQLRLNGRTFMVDLVMQAPARFSAAVRGALEAELPSLRPAVLRSRFHLHEQGEVAALVADLDRIVRTGSHGVVLKAPDVPAVDAAVRRVVAAGIPVVTFVTDLPGTPRAAYVGVDNRAAGSTAAYLLTRWLGPTSGPSEPAVLVVRGSASFRGEDDREIGFRGVLRRLAPGCRVLDVVDDDGPVELVRRVRDALEADPGVRGVYSMYAGAGGNAAVLDAFDRAGRDCAVFLAHDLDGENSPLLQQGRISAVLHHDLRTDVRRAAHVLLQARRALPGPISARPSDIQVVTPWNMPSATW